jgi:magnesium transporter
MVVGEDQAVSSDRGNAGARWLDSGVVDCAAYANGVRVADVAIDDISEVLKQRDRFIWIGLFEPTEALLRKVQDEFGLHDLAIEDAHGAHQRPKLEMYDESLFVVLRTAQLGEATQHIEFGETHVFVGQQYVVSVRHGTLQGYAGVRSRCESNPELLAQGPAFVLHSLMDFIVDQYFPTVEALEKELDQVEEEIFGDEFGRDTTTRIYRLKRELFGLKRAVTPLIEVCNRLTRLNTPLIPEDTQPYFRDVYDHVIRINEMIDTVRDLLVSALEANLSLMSVSQNEDMKRLAGWAAIIAAPTMIAGIYGMNFSTMPELHWQFGYPLIMSIMLMSCVGLWKGFKRSGWL